MMGVFVQVNTTSIRAKCQPVGYVITERGCWEWTGALRRDGYAETWDTITGRPVYAHRLLYELQKGPIPEGLNLDHLCRNHCCVNPDHLEPVTQRENVLRGHGACARNAVKTHCVRGHKLPDRGNKTERSCRDCKRLSDRQQYLKTTTRRHAREKSNRPVPALPVDRFLADLRA